MKYISYLAVVLLTQLGVSQAPPTIEQFLQSKHVANTPVSLQAGLTSTDLTVRGASAMQLALTSPETAAPPIRRALLAEHDSRTKLNMARALSTLGDPEGEAVRRHVCVDSDVSDDLRIQAAGELLPELGGQCILALANIVSESKTTPLIYEGLRVLNQEQAERAAGMGADPAVSQGLTSGLRSEVMIVRVEAAKAVALYKVRGAIPSLRSALKKENDPEAREVMSRAAVELAK